MCIRDRYLNDRLGTLAIDADAIKGFGVDNCVVTGVTLSGGVLSVTADSVSYTHLDVYKRQL